MLLCTTCIGALLLLAGELSGTRLTGASREGEYDPAASVKNFALVARSSVLRMTSLDVLGPRPSERDLTQASEGLLTNGVVSSEF